MGDFLLKKTCLGIPGITRDYVTRNFIFIETLQDSPSDKNTGAQDIDLCRYSVLIELRLNLT